jgi:hypothetical protein
MQYEYFLDLNPELCNKHVNLEQRVATVPTRLWQARQWVNATIGR